MRSIEEDSRVADFFLRGIEELRRREFAINMLFRMAFVAILTFIAIAGIVFDPLPPFWSTPTESSVVKRYNAAAGSVFVFSLLLFSLWIASIFLNRTRVNALIDAYKQSSTPAGREALDFLEISMKYNLSLRTGDVFQFLARIEPVLWFSAALMIGLINLDALNILP